MGERAPRPRIVSERPAPVQPKAGPLNAGVRSPGYDTRPCFASSWVEQRAADEDDTVANYQVAGVDVRVLSPPDSSYGLYLVAPPEYDLNPSHLHALADALRSITSHVPSGVQILSLETMRPYIKAKARDLLYQHLASCAQPNGMSTVLNDEAEKLSELLCKYTAGYGVLETLLTDPIIQDIYIDSPSWKNPVQVVLRSDTGTSVRQKCRTNIYVGSRDVQSFVSRVKFETGLPFSEAHPVLEADLRRLGARVTLVGPPLSAKGISVAIRKHSHDLWTLPKLIRNGSLSPLLSSFLWACVLGRRTVLVAGSRGAGKTTLLGAMMLEFPLSQRIVLIEDTPEVPASKMQALGYDIQTMRFSGTEEAGTGSAQEALRASLRMGESAIIIGEVRGAEARVLYESMRAGSAGSAVLGTIHGNSAKGVLDRALEDLGVSERAFSSTDIVVVIGLIRSPDGTRFERRVVEVAEVRESQGKVELVALFSTQPGCNCAKPTSEFSPQCKTVKGISEALGVGPEAMLEIIRVRAHADQALAESEHADEVHGDMFRVRSNEVLSHHLFAHSDSQVGLREWKGWFLEHAKAA